VRRRRWEFFQENTIGPIPKGGGDGTTIGRHLSERTKQKKTKEKEKAAGGLQKKGGGGVKLSVSGRRGDLPRMENVLCRKRKAGAKRKKDQSGKIPITTNVQAKNPVLGVDVTDVTTECRRGEA